MNLPERLLGVDEVARMLGVSRRTVYRMVELPWMDGPRPIRVGRLVRFHPAEVERWLNVGSK